MMIIRMIMRIHVQHMILISYDYIICVALHATCNYIILMDYNGRVIINGL